MKRLLDDVYSWSVFDEARQLDFNGWYLRVEDTALLVDPPPLSAEEADELERLCAPQVIAITNANHVRAARAARDRFGARVMVPEDDEGRVDVDPDGTYADGDKFLGGELRAIQLHDQKTPGETALYWAERRLLLVGDALIGKPAGSISLLPSEKYADVAKARAGLARLGELDVRSLLVGDGASLLEEGGEVLRAFLARD